MILTLTREELTASLAAQLRLFDERMNGARIERPVAQALERYEYCASRIALPGYSREGAPLFDHLHGDQSAIFLYFAANSAWSACEDVQTAAAFFLLNKQRNGLVCMYDTRLPEIFLLNHTVGTVLGKATYANYFVAYQRVTVGTDRGEQPVLAEGVTMYPGSSVVGAATVGARTILSIGATVRNADVPADAIVSGSSPSLHVHARRKDAVGRYFKVLPAPP